MPHLQTDIILIYFVYGLAFFSMGLVMMLESRRSPLLAEARVLRPLAVFGIVHGIHEWLEMALFLQDYLSMPYTAFIPQVRLGFLVISFTSLIVFGLQVLWPQQKNLSSKHLVFGVGLFGLYIVLVLWIGLNQRPLLNEWYSQVDSLARYILAVPGAALAAMALHRQSNQARGENRISLGRWLRVSAWCFVFYSMTQMFVPPTDIFLGQKINTGVFLQLTGLPIQLVRAVLAVLVTASLVRASQVVEAEREGALVSAQKARLEALEQVQRDLIERENLRRELLRHIVIAQEEERARIARELHDETAQYLSALRLNLATLHVSAPKTANLTDLISRLETLSRDMSFGIYRMVRDLRPAQLDDLGLVSALQHLADEERKRSGLEVTLEISGTQQRLESLVETVFFRVAQEALTNVARHAQCRRAVLRLCFSPEQVVLEVIDNGIGFDVQESHVPPRGWGLAGMRERAESVGGQLYLDSRPEEGTRVEIVIPTASFEQPETEETLHEYYPYHVS